MNLCGSIVLNSLWTIIWKREKSVRKILNKAVSTYFSSHTKAEDAFSRLDTPSPFSSMVSIYLMTMGNWFAFQQKSTAKIVSSCNTIHYSTSTTIEFWDNCTLGTQGIVIRKKGKNGLTSVLSHQWSMLSMSFMSLVDIAAMIKIDKWSPQWQRSIKKWEKNILKWIFNVLTWKQDSE